MWILIHNCKVSLLLSSTKDSDQVVKRTASYLIHSWDVYQPEKWAALFAIYSS